MAVPGGPARRPTVVVVRPGETEFDRESRIQGDLNLPLSERGEQQVTEVIEQLRPTGIEIIYASPTEPAATTAAAIGEALKIPVKLLDGLDNLDQGLWQGLLLEDVRRKHPRAFKQWRDTPESICPPEGETCNEGVQRITQALRRPLRKGVSFAVVACEPLATLVCSVLHGGQPQLPGPVCGCDETKRVEWIERAGVNGESIAPEVPAS